MHVTYMPSELTPSELLVIDRPTDGSLATIRVQVGARGSASEKTLEMDSIIIHPKFDFGFNYNIVLFRLKTELEYNQEVAPVCLSHAPKSSGSLCFTTGYNDTGRYLTTVDKMNECLSA